MPRGSCPACGAPAEHGPISVLGRRLPIGWNNMVRGHTHRGRPVYVCDGCQTPLEQTRFGYKATPAAKVALADWTGEVVEFMCKLEPGDMSSDLTLPVMDPDGKMRLREVEPGNEQYAKAHLFAIVYANAPGEKSRALLLQRLDEFLAPEEPQA